MLPLNFWASLWSGKRSLPILHCTAWESKSPVLCTRWTVRVPRRTMVCSALKEARSWMRPNRVILYGNGLMTEVSYLQILFCAGNRVSSLILREDSCILCWLHITTLFITPVMLAFHFSPFSKNTLSKSTRSGLRPTLQRKRGQDMHCYSGNRISSRRSR